jgi:ATP/ADP translocase
MRVGYDFDTNEVTWNTSPISNSIAYNVIQNLREDTWGSEMVEFEYQGVEYQAYLARYEKPNTWQLLPDAILFVKEAA